MAGWVVNGTNWMAGIKDDTALCDMSILGTHESAALYGGGQSQCQWLTIRDQLELGVRFLDVRCGNLDASGLASNERDDVERDDDFRLFHGSQDESDWFSSVLKQCVAFLEDHPTETILMNVQREDVGRFYNRPDTEFAAKFDRCVAKFSPSDMWSYRPPARATDPVRRMLHCRKKIVLIRAGWPAPANPTGPGVSERGWHWPGYTTPGESSSRFFWTQNGWKGDDYDTDAEKIKAVTKYLDLAAAGEAPNEPGVTDQSGKIYLNFISRAADPEIGKHALAVNKAIRQYLMSGMANQTGKLGTLPMDFVGNTGFRGGLEDRILRRNPFQSGCEFLYAAACCTVQIAHIDGQDRRWFAMVKGEDPWVKSDTPTTANPAIEFRRIIKDYNVLLQAPDGRYLSVSDDGRVGLFDKGTPFRELPGRLVSEKMGTSIAVTPTGGLWCVSDAGVTHPPVNVLDA